MMPANNDYNKYAINEDEIELIKPNKKKLKEQEEIKQKLKDKSPT